MGDKMGKFKQADKGTIFLDEISTSSPGLQVKLLRVLQEFEFEPVGSTKTQHVDSRVILATNEDLAKAVAAGRFRQDLFYRINVISIELPPLRERLADIPLLAQHFLARTCEDAGRKPGGFSDDVLTALQRLQLARQCPRVAKHRRAGGTPRPRAASRSGGLCPATSPPDSPPAFSR
jgi:transcriptional regulator with GAF, ATPase, and Fis domain